MAFGGVETGRNSAQEAEKPIISGRMAGLWSPMSAVTESATGMRMAHEVRQGHGNQREEDDQRVVVNLDVFEFFNVVLGEVLFFDGKAEGEAACDQHQCVPR